MAATVQTLAKISQLGFRASPGVGLPVSSTYLSLNESTLGGTTNPYLETFALAGVVGSQEYGFLGKLYYQASFVIEYRSGGAWVALSAPSDYTIVLDNYYTGRAGASIVRAVIFTTAGLNKFTVASSKCVRVSGFLCASYVDVGSVGNWDNFREVIVASGSDTTNFVRGTVVGIDTTTHQLVKFDAGNVNHSIMGVVNNLRNFGPTGTGTYSAANDPLLLDQVGTVGTVMFTVQIEGAFDTASSGIDTGVSSVVAGDLWYAAEGPNAGLIQNVAASRSALVGRAAEYYSGVTKLRLELHIGSTVTSSPSTTGNSENFLTVPLTSANISGWTKNGATLGTPAWDASTPIYGGGALKVIGTNLAAGAYVASPQFTVNPDRVGQAWKSEVSIKITGTYTDLDLQVILRDVTNGINIASDCFLSANGGVITVYPGVVYPSTSTVYEWRILAVNGATRSGSFNLWIANVKLGQWNGVSAPAVGTEPAYTPTFGSGFTGATVRSMSLFRNLTELVGRISMSTGTVSANPASLTLPAGKTANVTENIIVGFWTRMNAGAVNKHGTIIAQVGSNVLLFGSDAVAGTTLPDAVQNASALFSSSEDLDIELTGVPIEQWPTANLQLSSEANRYFTIAASPSESLSGTQLSTLSAGTINITLPFSLGAADEPVVEIYRGGGWTDIAKYYPWTTGATTFGVRVISTAATVVAVTLGTYAEYATTAWSTLTTSFVRLRVKRGGANAEVPPTIRAEYHTDTGIAADNPIRWDTQAEDTHNCVTTGAAWKFTAPITGIYDLYPIAVANGGNFTLRLWKGGVVQYPIGVLVNGSAADNPWSLRLSAGEYFDLRPQGGGTAGSSAARIVIVYRGK